VQRTVGRLAESVDTLASIGVACAGGIHANGGSLPTSPERRDAPVAAALATRFGVPVTLESDVRAAAWGEFRFGGHRARSLVAVFVGAGVGSGAVLDGALWRGAGDAAGELGHTLVVLDGLLCPCGAHGCLEQYASTGGLQRRYRAALGAGARSRLDQLTGTDPDTLSPAMVAAAANSGDELARQLWLDLRRYLALATANSVTLLDPEVLVFGGSLVEALPELVDEVAGAVLAATTPRVRESLRIERARLGDWAAVLGAAALAAA
jgi:glucokinase